ncbi:MAG TPA: agmatinase [Actinomycetota bacterium]|jgi:agmatinase|nr:agmatinase [Actinomycetota bacterium]
MSPDAEDRPEPLGPADPLTVPRFAGPPTFARLPRRDEVDRCDVAVVGIPFDAGTTYRPGARFGPHAVRNATRLLRSYHPGLEVRPFGVQQVADAGDIACNPFDLQEALTQIEAGAEEILSNASFLLSIGGDHTIALPLLRAMRRRHGPIALLHFDAHLDTWDTYFGAAYTHGTPFRRAWEEGLLLPEGAVHVGIRGPLFSPEDLVDDRRFGFEIVGAMDLESIGIDGAVERIRARLAGAPVYVSVDIDVLDPAHAPGTGTPEPGGLTSRELLGILRGLAGVSLVGADVVEVAPPFDHAEITAMAASHVSYELLGLFARRA